MQKLVNHFLNGEICKHIINTEIIKSHILNAEIKLQNYIVDAEIIKM